MAFSLGEYQDIFLEEADDQLQELNKNLLNLEKKPDDEDTINNIFRAAHSLKSSAAFVGLTDLSELSHKMENLLQGIRDKTMSVTPEIVEILFKCFDLISNVIETVSEGQSPTQNLSDMITQLGKVGSKASASGKASPAKVEKTEKVEKAEMVRTPLTPQDKKLIKKGIDSGLFCNEIVVSIEREASMKWIKAQLMINNLRGFGQVIRSEPSENEMTDEKIGGLIRFFFISGDSGKRIRRACEVDLVTRIEQIQITLVQKENKFVIRYADPIVLFEEKKTVAPIVPITDSKASDEKFHEIDDDDDHDDSPKITQGKQEKGATNAPTLRTVKVSVEKLDELLNAVGELVISNSGFYRLYEDLRGRNVDKSLTNEFKSRMDQMGRIAKDLQSGIMKTRMVPIGQVFARFNRLVRDLAKECDKQVKLVIKGEETELDKKVIDVIGEPLMHLVRNAMDHGLESKEERAKTQKGDVGIITLDAYQSGNQILVEVSDDGRGLNVTKIRRKALDRGLATPDQIANMDEQEIYEFIFHPGFSTAETITDISGRGVGMNVVREVVNEMNGSIQIESELGMGTRFVMSFPLTLAIIPAIMVKVQKERYAVPLSDVIETIKIAYNDITTIEGHEVINLRGEILSLLRLNEFIGIESALDSHAKTPVVVVGYSNRKIGLIVDFLEGKQEIVIKSLEQNYTTVSGLAGASILGDGSICLILDISSMISKVISQQEKLSRDQRQKILSRDQVSVEILPPKNQLVEDLQGSISQKGGSTVIFAQENAGEPVKESKSRDIAEQKLNVEEKIKSETITLNVPLSQSIAQKEIPAANISAAPSKEELPPEERVKKALLDFRTELEENVKSSMQGAPDEHIRKSLSVSDDDLKKIQVLANVGITQGAESLSRIINKRVDLAIPEVKLLPVERIPASVGGSDDVYIGVFMPITGDIKGTVLLTLSEHTAFELLDGLFGLAAGQTDELTEDGESALKEITNIVGTAVLNSFSEKTGLVIMPDVPLIKRDYIQAIMDAILALYNLRNDYALLMDTEFYYQDDRVMGNLLVLPEVESLRVLVDHIRED